MIRNQRQYRITRAREARFAEDLKELQRQVGQGDVTARVMARAVEAQLRDLRKELEAYDELQRSGPQVFAVHTLTDLPEALIRTRIATGLTQKELAERLGLKAQQIQRYEDGGYRRASLERLLEVSEALRIVVADGTVLPTTRLTSEFVVSRLTDAGIDRSLIERRIAPAAFSDSAADALELATRAAAIFGWSVSALLGSSDAPTGPLVTFVDDVSFRLHRRVNQPRLAAHANYARYLAGLVVRATPSLPSRALPTDPQAMLALLDNEYGGPTLQGILDLLWDHGTRVMPMDEPGGFQGAAWRIGGSNVAVLNSRSDLTSRWIHDLLHESFHLAQHPEDTDLEFLETGDLRGVPDSEEERRAEAFARDVELRGNAEALVAQVNRRARNSIPRFKSVTRAVAAHGGVEVGALANYLAWRLDMQGRDWWGAARNLQTPSEPYQVVRDRLMMELDLSKLSEREARILVRGFQTLEDTHE